MHKPYALGRSVSSCRCHQSHHGCLNCRFTQDSVDVQMVLGEISQISWLAIVPLPQLCTRSRSSTHRQQQLKLEVR